ncbi:hypothetical protein BRCON_2187 [Candidatus Sumerlaea chitinivorans]|uniref:Uncharacterized protein n=1 Tax=Sumerlaea chitinivorans TaxID=2250252 RepID=A0A2Z4Y6X5_SUMC1|nr:hypothetical protein BRCON_2187 [Candidatus Sumerlaea chitinivorans]
MKISREEREGAKAKGQKSKKISDARVKGEPSRSLQLRVRSPLFRPGVVASFFLTLRKLSVNA